MALMGHIPSAKADSTSSSTKPLPLVLLGHSYLGAILALELAKASFFLGIYIYQCIVCIYTYLLTGPSLSRTQ